MRTSFGGLNEAGLEEQSMQAASQQKQLQQQVGDSSQSNTGGSALKSKGQNSQQQAQVRKPREVGGLKQELVERPMKDIGQEVKKFFDINALLNINPVEDTPEEQARKKKMLQRWQKLTKAEQKVAQEKYQEKLRKEQEEERQKQIKKQREEEQKQQTIAPPSSPKKGPGMFKGGQKGNKGKAMNQLQQQRQTIGTVSSRN
jgi:hypothetical protein